MNSEELDLSLRSEFENYLKAVVAEMRKESTEFQSNIEAELERHKSQFNEAFQAFNARFESEHQFDEGFKSLVAEHLNLARDAGSKLAADAMAEAEKLAPVAVAAEPTIVEVEVNKFDGLRDAINDISSQDSQSSILKALIQHASEYASRGAFFIVKNEHFVGWKVFGNEADALEAVIREIRFPSTSGSIIGDAARSLTTVERVSGTNADDSIFVDPLNYGSSERMYAIPLTARGRGVAVLVADAKDGAINREALEVLVRVAGMTVEMRATSVPAAKPEEGAKEGFAPSQMGQREVTAEAAPRSGGEFAFSESGSVEGGFPPEVSEFGAKLSRESSLETYPQAEVEVAEGEFPQTVSAEPAEEARRFEEVLSYESPAVEVERTDASPFSDTGPEPETAEFDYGKYEPAIGSVPAPYQVSETSDVGSVETEPLRPESIFEPSSDQYAPAGMPSGGMEPAVEAVIEAPVMTPSVPKARLSDRNVDLPIEVAEDERRIHNDARRFARLLVSEIKLYNEKKVTEGREAGDLYERLREAIDRSREMYDKRVQPPVASKFDYFHYELVNSLADGQAGRLGNGYPGSTI